MATLPASSSPPLGSVHVIIDHVDEAGCLGPGPLAHHHHVHAAKEESVVIAIRSGIDEDIYKMSLSINYNNLHM